MNPQEEKLALLEQKIDAVYASVEKSRKYLLTIVIITVVTVVLPLLIMAFALPSALSSLESAYQI
jgi:type IV secretory pathway component VirB8